MSYDFKKAKLAIEAELNSEESITSLSSIPEDSLSQHKNGVKAWVGSIFVDVVSSSAFFNNSELKQEVISKITKSLFKQIVSIMRDNNHIFEVGIREDRVYGIFKAEYKQNILSIFKTAYCINTFQKMFNVLLKEKEYPFIYVGIGIGAGHDLIVPVSDKINDKIWIGDAMINASKLSKIANRDGIQPICMDSTTYENIIGLLEKENPNYSYWIEKASSFNYDGPFYQCNIVQTNFNEWIKEGMK